MTFDELNAEWAKDAPIGENLTEETRRIPKLHAKYLEEVKETTMKGRIAKAKLAQLVRDKTEYYSGAMDALEARERGWEPLQRRILKADVSAHVEADSDVVALSLKIGLIEDKAKYLDEIMRSIRDRNYLIKNIIEWQKYCQNAH